MAIVVNRRDRGPLRVMFFLTSMVVGGAETLLMNLIRGMNRTRFQPEIACLKQPGPLGAQMGREIPVHFGLIAGKYDITVLPKIASLLRDQKIDAAITVGCGDKMFWGRLAAWHARIPVIASALHSTGWPDGVGHLNRWLTPITDAFIAVADSHATYLETVENFPRHKIHVIPNGVDMRRFTKKPRDASSFVADRQNGSPVATIVAALRPEKNHRRFLEMARLVVETVPQAKFQIIGDGPLRSELEAYVDALGIRTAVAFLGCRDDIPKLIQESDVFVLTSDNEAAPVSILEASAAGIPVVAPNVGSVPELVIDGVTGYVVPKEASAFAERLCRLLLDPPLRRALGDAGRRHVEQCGSLERMIEGYQTLIESIYDKKAENSQARPAVVREQVSGIEKNALITQS